MATKNQFPVDDLVKNLLTEDNTIPADLSVFFGFIGEGKSEDTITVYFDVYLRQAIEIAKEDILHSIRLTKTQNPLGGMLIWLTNTTKYFYGTPPTSHQAEEQLAQHYFGGTIYQQYITQNQAAGNTQPQAAACCPHHPQQQVFTANCEPTQAPICPDQTQKDQ